VAIPSIVKAILERIDFPRSVLKIKMAMSRKEHCTTEKLIVVRRMIKINVLLFVQVKGSITALTLVCIDASVYYKSC